MKVIFYPFCFLLMLSYGYSIDTNNDKLVVPDNSVSLTLPQCIQIAQSKSNNAKMTISAYKKRQLSYIQFSRSYYPQMQLGGSVPGLERAINRIVQNDGTEKFLPQSQLYSSMSLYLQQKVPLTGADIYLSSGISRLDYFETNNSYFWLTNPLQLRIVQPLFKLNTMRWDRELEDLKHSNSEKQLTEEMEDIAIAATTKFFDLYIAQMRLKNAEFNLAVNDTLYQLSKGRYSVGKIAENDLLQSELALMNVKYELETAKITMQQAEEDLKLYLNIDKNIQLNIIPPLDIPNLRIDAEEAITQAKQNRSDIVENDILALAAERGIAEAKSNNRFQASVSASFGLNKTASSVPDAYKDFLEQENVNISFEIPLFQWGKGDAEIESAIEEQKRVNSSIAIKNYNFDLDVKYQTMKFNLYQNQVAISAKSDTIAQRRFLVAKNRYLIGKIDLNSYFISLNEKDDALTSFISTLRSFWISYYQMRRLTLYDFENKNKIFYKTVE